MSEPSSRWSSLCCCQQVRTTVPDIGLDVLRHSLDDLVLFVLGESLGSLREELLGGGTVLAKI